MATKHASTSKTSNKKELEKKKKAEEKAKDKEKKRKAETKAAAAAQAVQSADATALAKEKLKKRGKGATEVTDDEVEEKAIEMMGGAEVDADAQKDDDQEDPVHERKEVQDLLAAGKQKGFVTFDEVNDALPGDAVSPEQIDDVMSMFGDNDVEVVDAQKASEGTVEVKPTVAAEEDAAEEEEDDDDDEEEKPAAAAATVPGRPAAKATAADDAGTKSNDPVRLYLRKMGSVSLLTREGEVEIAKRIEDGEKDVMRALLDCKVAVNEISTSGPASRRASSACARCSRTRRKSRSVKRKRSRSSSPRPRSTPKAPRRSSSTRPRRTASRTSASSSRSSRSSTKRSRTTPKISTGARSSQR